MEDLRALLLGETFGDERAVARFRVALDAQERCGVSHRQLAEERCEVGAVEDVVQVPIAERRRELFARPLADADPIVLAVLKLA